MIRKYKNKTNGPQLMVLKQNLHFNIKPDELNEYTYIID